MTSPGTFSARYPLGQHRDRGEVVDRHVEEALDLTGVEVDGDDAVDARGREHVGDEAGGDRLVAPRPSGPVGRSRSWESAVILLAEARFAASIMISCSITPSLTGVAWVWTMKTSPPRILSSNRQ